MRKQTPGRFKRLSKPLPKNVGRRDGRGVLDRQQKLRQIQPPHLVVRHDHEATRKLLAGCYLNIDLKHRRPTRPGTDVLFNRDEPYPAAGTDTRRAGGLRQRHRFGDPR